MNNHRDLRQQRRSTVNSMTLLAVGGIAGVLAIAAVTLWLNWPGTNSQSTAVEVDPMSLIG